MTRIALVVLVSLISQIGFGQNRKLHIKKYVNGENSLWYKWRMELCAKTELDSIQNSEYNWHFRLWTNKQAIDVWKDLEGKSFGKVTSWVEENTPYEEEPTYRIFSESKALDSISINRLIGLVDATSIKSIPDEDAIEGWEQGFDGITYMIETADSDAYSFKTYWTPRAQDSLKEAIVVQDFADRSLEIIKAKEIWTDFTSKIPFECYRDGGIMIGCKILTRREKKKYKKERENYRKQKL